MLSLPKYKVFSVAEAYWPDPPSPTGENFLSFILGTWIINEYEKANKKLAFVFNHDIKTFEGIKSSKGEYAFSCFDIIVKHSCTFLIHNFNTEDLKDFQYI